MENSNLDIAKRDLSLLLKIRVANEFLTIENDNTQKKVVKILNERKQHRNKSGFISEGSYSSYVGATDYVGNVNPKMAWQLVRALDELIEVDYKHAWNNSEKKYVSIEKKELDKNIVRLEGLVDTWEAYSWDGDQSRVKNEGYIHAFKIRIEEVDKILCSTQGCTFKEGRMYLIGFDKVCIEISHSARKVFFVLHIGSSEAEDINERQEYTMAYTDSGEYTVRAGVVAIRRTKREYDSIECESKPLSVLKDEWPELEELKDKQFILTY